MLFFCPKIVFGIVDILVFFFFIIVTTPSLNDEINV